MATGKSIFDGLALQAEQNLKIYEQPAGFRLGRHMTMADAAAAFEISQKESRKNGRQQEGFQPIKGSHFGMSFRN
jgi:hypothetical protein